MQWLNFYQLWTIEDKKYVYRNTILELKLIIDFIWAQTSDFLRSSNCEKLFRSGA